MILNGMEWNGKRETDKRVGEVDRNTHTINIQISNSKVKWIKCYPEEIWTCYVKIKKKTN